MAGSDAMNNLREGIADYLELRRSLGFKLKKDEITAEPVRSGAEARELLVRQLTAPVLWSASVATMVREGADRFLELGAGSVLCGLNKRNAKGAPCTSVGAPADLDAWAAHS